MRPGNAKDEGAWDKMRKTIGFRFLAVYAALVGALILLGWALALMGGVGLPTIFNLLPAILAGADAGIQTVRVGKKRPEPRELWQLAVFLMGITLLVSAFVAIASGGVADLKGPAQFLLGLMIYAAIITLLIRFFLWLGVRSEAERQGL